MFESLLPFWFNSAKKTAEPALLMWMERGEMSMVDMKQRGLGVRRRISHDDPVTYIFSACLTWQRTFKILGEQLRKHNISTNSSPSHMHKHTHTEESLLFPLPGNQSGCS